MEICKCDMQRFVEYKLTQGQVAKLADKGALAFVAIGMKHVIHMPTYHDAAATPHVFNLDTGARTEITGQQALSI